MCSILPETDYIGQYQKHIQRFLQFDFYNIICDNCASINKTIMINRSYHFASTIRNCRTCGIMFQTDVSQTQNPKINDKIIDINESILWFSKKNEQCVHLFIR